jgi:hypothetical protein
MLQVLPMYPPCFIGIISWKTSRMLNLKVISNSIMVYCLIDSFTALVILSEAKNLVFRLLRHFVLRNDSVKNC